MAARDNGPHVYSEAAVWGTPAAELGRLQSHYGRPVSDSKFIVSLPKAGRSVLPHVLISHGMRGNIETGSETSESFGPR